MILIWPSISRIRLNTSKEVYDDKISYWLEARVAERWNSSLSDFLVDVFAIV